MKTVINIKTEAEIKRSAKEVADRLGLSLSAVLNAYLRQFIRNREAHFTLAPKMSSELEELLGRIEIDIQRDKNISPEISSENGLKRHFSSR